MKTGLMLFALTILFLTGCQKQQPNPATEIPENALWRAPNGYVIPWSEHDDWEAFTAQAFAETKELKKYWKSEMCETAETSCGLACVKSSKSDSDCSKESACAPCVACGCTPITSPY